MRYRGNDLVLGTDGSGRPVVLSEAERRLHTWLTGRTGTGKSRLQASMVWQDIEQWSRSQHGLLLLDPDGETYDQIVRRLAEHPEYSHRPIVLIDLRRDDHVIGYNLLRRRAEDDPAVTALNLLEAITVAFGDTDVMAKPTLYRTAVTILRALIEADMSLAHAPLVLDPLRVDLREKLAKHVTDPIALANLSRINNKSITDKTGRQFDEETLAFANRMFGPLSNQLLRHMFGQTTASFDFDWALDIGAIVLVSLATEGNKVTETDARMVGALLLADLWQAARRRGKRGCAAVKGFYAYIDEFQTMLTPTIAKQLARARGYGLYFTLANQLVSQLRDNGGQQGDAIYHAIIGNTGNKIVFRASSDEEDLRPLTRAVFLGEVDVDKVKNEITSFQVVDHEEIREVLRGGSTTESRTRTQSTSVGASEGISHTEGLQHGSGWQNGIGESVPIEYDATGGGALGTANTSISESGSEATSVQDGTSSSETYSASAGTAEGRAKGTSWSQSVRMRPIIRERVSSRTFESVENQLFAFDQLIAGLPARAAIVKLAESSAPILMRTRDMPDSSSGPMLVEHTKALALAQLPFALSKAVAVANLAMLDRPLLDHNEAKEEGNDLPAFARRRRSPRDEGASDDA